MTHEIPNISTNNNSNSKKELLSHIRPNKVLESTLKSLNNKILIDIYNEYLIKSGVPNNIDNYIYSDAIKPMESSKKHPLGLYTEHHIIELSIDNIHKSAKSLYDDFLKPNFIVRAQTKKEVMNKIIRIRILETIIHENTHAIARQYNCPPIQTDLDKVESHFHTGFLSNIKYKNKYNIKFNIKHYEEINEGVTQLITERILKEYLRRTGQAGKIEKAYLSIPVAKRGGYEHYILSIQYYIIFISALSDIPPDIVETSIIKAYLRGDELIPNEVLIEFSELIKLDEFLSLRDNIRKLEDPDKFKSEIIDILRKLPREKYNNAKDKLNTIISTHYGYSGTR